MSDGTNNSLINFGDLSKPANTLIKKITKAVGQFYEPRQIRKVAQANADATIINAKAKADAAIIEAEAKVKITEIERRAIYRLIEEEGKKQQNIEDITNKAIPFLHDETDAEKMDDDWVTNFFDKARIISDNEMQSLWAQVLAGEANKPGSFSKRTVNFLNDVDKRDADLFTTLCGFAFTDFGPLIFDVQKKIYNNHNINFSTLTHLESIGLIQFNNISGFVRLELPNKFVIFYFGKPMILEMKEAENRQIDIGRILLTQTGKELASICGSKPVDGFYDYVKEHWKQYVVLG